MINSLGKYWTDLVHSFRIPKVEHNANNNTLN